MSTRVGEIVEVQAAGLSSFPVVEFDDVLAGRVGEAERTDSIRRVRRTARHVRPC